MASFDFVDAAVKGYKFLWDERAIILRMAVPLFLIKFVSFVFVMAFQLEENILRQGLIYLPSYFVEGWLLAQMIRLFIFGERWPVLRTESNAALIAERLRTIKASIVIFVLTKIVLTTSSGLATASAPSPESEVPEATVMTFLAGMLVLAAMIWAFRLLWLHIPAAMGYPLTAFLKKAAGYMTSIYMIGTWLICLLPPAMLLVMISEALLGLSGGVRTEFYTFTMAGLQAAAEIMIAIIVTIGIAHGIDSIIRGEDRARDEY